jgi:hypothetical protein
MPGLQSLSVERWNVMLKVIRVSSERFIVMAEKHAVYGDKLRAIYVLREIGLEWPEIEEGMVSLELNSHDVAYYGIGGTFIYSGKAA